MVSDKALREREEVRFPVLRLIKKRPDASQRNIAQTLGASLGAINFCIRALLVKGHVKRANLKSSRTKPGYGYMLTPEAIAHRASLARRSIEHKMIEYKGITIEIKQLRAEFVTAADDAGE